MMMMMKHFVSYWKLKVFLVAAAHTEASHLSNPPQLKCPFVDVARLSVYGF